MKGKEIEAIMFTMLSRIVALKVEGQIYGLAGVEQVVLKRWAECEKRTRNSTPINANMPP